MVTPEERNRLIQARELIKQRQYEAARAILVQMPENETAQKWLAKLDQAAPARAQSVDAPSPVSPSSPPPAPQPATPGAASLSVNPVTLRYIIGGVVGVLGLLMIVGFFLFSWMDLGQVSFFGASIDETDSGEDLTISAMEIWMGRNGGEDFTLDLSNDSGGGIGDVRLLDRSLILVPVLALVLMWTAWVYTSGDMKPLPALGVMAGVAVVLLIFPFLWETFSEDDWREGIKAQMQADAGDDELDLEFDFGFESMFVNLLTSAYSTNEQKLAGGIAFMFCLVGLALEYMAANPSQPAAVQPPGGDFV